MLDRYSKPEMAELFTVAAQWAAARTVELAAVKARCKLGQITPYDVGCVLQLTPEVTDDIVRLISEREATTDHDVAAFVDVMQEAIDNEAARWFHYGLTSADVTDTALCLRLTEAADLLITEAENFLESLCGLAREHSHTPTAGRTHGQHAEVITFGVRVANWAQMVDRAITSLRQARDGIAVGKLSGACGTYSNIDPQVQELVCKQLGLKPILATQVVPRDLHAELIHACVRVGAAIGHIAFNLRIMASTEFGEVEEGRRPGQKGSSAMPHKRNPIKLEQFNGLVRQLRGYAVAADQNVELLLERDISHSAPERIYLGDTMILAHYLVVTARIVIERLVVKPERMRENIERGLGLMFTQTLLTALIDDRWQREPAYRLVQDLSNQALAEQRHLREVLAESLQAGLSAEEIDRIFDESRFFRHVDHIMEQLPA